MNFNAILPLKWLITADIVTILYCLKQENSAIYATDNFFPPIISQHMMLNSYC